VSQQRQVLEPDRAVDCRYEVLEVGAKVSRGLESGILSIEELGLPAPIRLAVDGDELYGTDYSGGHIWYAMANGPLPAGPLVGGQAGPAYPTVTPKHLWWSTEEGLMRLTR